MNPLLKKFILSFILFIILIEFLFLFISYDNIASYSNIIASLNEKQSIKIIYIILTLCFTLFFILFTQSWLKIISLNFAFLFLVLLLSDLLITNLSIKRIFNGNVVHEDSPGFIIESDTLGFRPQKNMINNGYSYTKYLFPDSLVLNCKQNYTIDENGLRKTPDIIPCDDTRSIIFFGCSVMYGFGLPDEQVIPYLVQDSLKSEYKAYNFAFVGYGTHQMLSLIENHMVDSVIEFEPKYIIYLMLSDHINRSINRRPWTYHDPKYIINPITLEPMFVGNYDKCENKFCNSKFGKLLTHRINDESINLNVSMVVKSKNLLLAKYPHCEFHVICWNSSSTDPRSEKMILGLREQNIKIHLLSEIVPDYRTSKSSYQIKGDGHPNAKLHKLFAEYILNNIINK